MPALDQRRLSAMWRGWLWQRGDAESVCGRLAGYHPLGGLGMRWIGASPQAKKRDSVSPAGLTTTQDLHHDGPSYAPCE